MSTRLPWINTVKALSMMSVYLLHSAEFTGGGNSLIYSFIHPFYVNAFFAVSGYLFFRKWLNINDCDTNGRYIAALKNILYRLVFPTIIFSTILYIPKMFYHSQGSTIGDFIYNTIGGCSFWFTSALTISQIYLLTCLRLKIKTLYSMSLMAIILCCILPLLKTLFPSPFPWYFKSGLAATILMIAGGWIYRTDQIDYKFKHSKILGNIILIIYVISVFAVYHFNIPTRYALMSVTVNPCGILLSSLGIISIFIIAHRIKSYLFIQFIGENSIIFYFLSGAIPATIATIFKNLHGNTINSLFVGFFAIICGYILTKLIVKYMPFLTDIRSLSQHKS